MLFQEGLTFLGVDFIDGPAVERDELVELLQVHGHRLDAQHVLAGLEGGLRHLQAVDVADREDIAEVGSMWTGVPLMQLAEAESEQVAAVGRVLQGCLLPAPLGAVVLQRGPGFVR